MNGLECVAYLFALKICSPNKLFLLRGNHETRDVNGWEDHYGDRSFLRQCKARFGRELGESVSCGVMRTESDARLRRSSTHMHRYVRSPLPPTPHHSTIKQANRCGRP